AIEVPNEFTFHPPIAKPNPAATTPKLAAPDPTPARAIAVATATVEKGETIKNAKDTDINIPITIGCKVVNLLITSPIASVIPLTYGSVTIPIVPATITTIAGFGISGLIGPINALNLMGGYTTSNIIIVTLIFVVVPIALGILFNYVFTKIVKIVSEEDYKLTFE
ncbi:hypothetical protein GNF83_17995, partial [Clostridium perfringens]|nr:hypothetical protein [Clostridium perfringens]